MEAEAEKHTQSTPSTRSFKDAGPARARIETRAKGGTYYIKRADVPSIMRRRLERVELAVPSCLGEPPDACVRRASRRRRAVRRTPENAPWYTATWFAWPDAP